VSRRTLYVSAFLTWHAALAWAQPQTVSDFPPQDHSTVITLERDGLRALADALRTQPARASAVEVLLRHGYIDESLAVLSRIVAADGPELLPALKAATETTEWWNDQKRRDEINIALARIVNGAVTAANRRPRNEAADIARYVLRLQTNISRGSRDSWTTGLRAFVKEYDGTPAAVLAEVELMADTLPIAQQIEASERFAREHEGTVAGARALYHAGFQLAHNYAITGLETRGSDPTDRLFRVAAIARELESGRYPPCEWVARAPTLVTGFFVSDSPAPSYAPGNVQRSLDVYADLVRTHLTWQDPFPPNDSIAHMVSHSMWKLWTRQGDPMAGAERFFEELAADPGAREAARFLQARTYLNRVRDEPHDQSPSRAKAIALLTDLARDGPDRVRRKAHAMLAAELFASGDDQRACTEFRRFGAAYPQSDWAWVANLRLGQCAEALQQWQGAANAYRRAATMQADKPAAVLLGHAYAARALEGTADFRAALNEYQRAIAAWFGKHSARYALSSWRRIPAAGALSGRDTTEVMKTDLELRREQLRAAIAMPGGTLLERARWALAHRSRNDARALASQLMMQFPRSPLALDARYLARLADYEDALDLAAADDPRDVAGAQERLQKLSSEPHDVITSLARIARASLMAIQGTPGSEALMKEALENWRTTQVAARAAAPGSLEAEADAVRRTVFRPLGGGVYGGGWNAMDWPSSLPPFLIAPATLPVHESDGRVRIVSASRPLPGLENTLYLSQQDFELLERTIAVLDGSLRRIPMSVMATPNQPAGASETIMRLWNRFFPMRAGHWGGWEFATYPVITRIEFTNPQRTKASVPVTVGYSGGTVLLEKIDGQWRALDIVNRWIT
jgi:tetratricopeptide (TPR) repeat protein